MTQSKNWFRLILWLATFGLLSAGAFAVSSRPVPAVTLELLDGPAMSGFLGEVDTDIVMLYRPGPYAIELDRIVRVIPHNIDDPTKQAIQASRIRDLNRLIDHKAGAFAPFQEHVRTLLDERDYDALESVAVKAWEDAQRTADGEWLLSAFYPAFRKDIGKRDVPAFEQRREQIEAWRVARPNSAHALTALLRITLDLAWAHRGGGYSSKVATKDRSATAYWMAEATQLGEQLVLKDKLDGEMLYQLSNVVLSISPEGPAGSIDHELSVLALAARAAKVAPDYHHGLFGFVRKTLPRWRGSAAEMDVLLTTVMNNLPEDRRAEAYFRMVNWVLTRYGSSEYVKFDFDWAIIHSGYETMSRRWPDFDKHRHEFAALAYLHGKPEVARELFKSVYPGWNFVAKSVWRYPEAMVAVQRWSTSAAVNSSVTTLGSPDSAGLIAGLRTVGQGSVSGFLRYVAAGGDADARDETGRSLLQHAVKNRHPLLVYALISAGADVEQINSRGWQAVHYAADSGSANILQMLEIAGASMDVAVKNGDTPLNMAANESNRKAFSWLLKRAPHTVNQAGNKGYTPLLHVAYDGHEDMTAELLAVDGIEVDAATDFGETALHQAARRGNEGVVRLLLAAGADSRRLNKRNNSVMALAKESGNTSLIKLLQDRGLVLVSGVSDDVIDRSNSFVTQANVLYVDGDMSAAIALYQKAVDVYPQSKSAHIGMAISLWMEKKPKAALRSIKTAIRIDPKNADLYYKAGRIAFSAGDRAQYMNFFSQYLKMEPDTYNAKDLLKRLPELAKT